MFPQHQSSLAPQASCLPPIRSQTLRPLPQQSPTSLTKIRRAPASSRAVLSPVRDPRSPPGVQGVQFCCRSTRPRGPGSGRRRIPCWGGWSQASRTLPLTTSAGSLPFLTLMHLDIHTYVPTGVQACSTSTHRDKQNMFSQCICAPTTRAHTRTHTHTHRDEQRGDSRMWSHGHWELGPRWSEAKRPDRTSLNPSQGGQGPGRAGDSGKPGFPPPSWVPCPAPRFLRKRGWGGGLVTLPPAQSYAHSVTLHGVSVWV